MITQDMIDTFMELSKKNGQNPKKALEKWEKIKAM